MAGSPSGRSQGGRARVKTARGRTAASTRWLERQLNDPYVKAAKSEGYRSRAAYKLLELDERFKLLGHAQRVIDLGAAPGGWTQVVLKKRPKAKVAAIDLLAMDPIPGVAIFQKDFLDDDAEAMLVAAIEGAPDLIVSDMAANTVGHRQTDQIRTMALVETAIHFATQVLAPNGAFIAKVFAGGADPALVAELKRHFKSVKHAKPPASRKESSEWYVIAQGFKGAAG
ncbi:RlmE family RNA methyltransferase [Sphingoaurantiacus capsulatus]|uniref:Ribosomal RNA large subunit methyltransferase E n=1 Tax=Sphingoaurantiacus capsulatus TaxID=1771310 RepID=A0ABV7XCX4_9SPHN